MLGDLNTSNTTLSAWIGRSMAKLLCRAARGAVQTVGEEGKKTEEK